MHTRLALFVGLFLLPLTTTAQTQQRTTFGLGAGFDGDPTISVPITTSNLRIEPTLGLVRNSVSRENGEDFSESVFRIGTGVFALQSYESTLIQIGGRIQIIRNGTTRGESSESTIDLGFGPAVGGEYYLSNHFSFGVEATLIYTNLGEENDTVSRTRLETNAGAFARVHF